MKKKFHFVWYFAHLFVPLQPQFFGIVIFGLSYGVMVAQQVLVLFVVVRIRLGQQKGQKRIMPTANSHRYL